MRRIVFGLSITLVLAGLASAQTPVKANSVNSVDASAAAAAGSRIAAGTQVSGRLQGTLDVERAKVGDQVLVKTTTAVKQNGQTVIAKGSTLVGHVTSVQKKVKGNANSSIGVAFESVQQGSGRLPISAAITSVLTAQTHIATAVDHSVMATESDTISAGSSTRSSGGGGGLLGGVTSTVGGVANTATGAVGGVADTTGRAVGSTTGAVGAAVRGLTVTQSTGASAHGGSTLNMSDGNLSLDKGTILNLRITNSSSASAGKN
jgi:hypothetical protein